MKYTIYLLGSKSVGYIYGPNKSYSVWIAVVKDDGSTFVPEDTSKPEDINAYCKVVSSNLDVAIKMAWQSYPKSIKHHCVAYKDFVRIANKSLSDWSKNKEQEQESGATCKKCNVFNEYATKADNYTCSSCKSYDEMYV